MAALGARAALGAALALGSIAGCDRKPERFADAEGGPFEAIVRRNLEPVEAATGMQFKRFPTVRATSAAQVRAFAEKALNEPDAVAELEGQEQAYKLFGLLPESLDVRKMYLDVLEEQIAGLYDPETDALYVRDSKDDALVGVAIAHEMIHALQDQYVDLDSLRKIRGDNDRAMALGAVVEGHAVYSQLVATAGGSRGFELKIPGGWQGIRDMIREQRSSMPALATAPMVIQETLIFPYLSGADFVNRFAQERRDTSPVFDLPVSTEQILHTDAFFGERRDAPTTVVLPPPRVGRPRYDNNLGEFETRLFLFQHLFDQDAAFRGAAGWDGDRYVILDTPRGRGIAWVTVWDSAMDAAEFHDIMERLLRKRYEASLPRVEGSSRTYRGKGRMLSLVTGEVDQRPVVLFVDVPEGVSTQVLNLGSVQLR